MTGDDGDGDETIALDPRVLRLWRLRGGLAAGPPILAVAVGVGLASGVVAALGALVALVAVSGGLVWWWTALVWRSWRFRVAPGALELRHGVLTRRESTIPFHRVQHIDTEAGPMERHLGLTTLVLRTASASSDATVPGIDAGEADALRTRILALVGTGDAV